MNVKFKCESFSSFITNLMQCPGGQKKSDTSSVMTSSNNHPSSCMLIDYGKLVPNHFLPLQLLSPPLPPAPHPHLSLPLSLSTVDPKRPCFFLVLSFFNVSFRKPPLLTTMTLGSSGGLSQGTTTPLSSATNHAAALDAS